MYSDLAGKTVLVTGCGKKTGIGYAIARKFASCGSNVIIADLGVQAVDGLNITPGLGEMEEIANDLGKEFSVKTFAVAVDVSSTESVKTMAEKVKEVFGHVDVLCNNAGVTFGVPSTVMDY
ncbi:MAG TPA: SDR family oxidoreductase, partial [Spirochaetota bacterium]|nr:SDR family oxidoreductase [Spirochaetota bacterium]